MKEIQIGIQSVYMYAKAVKKGKQREVGEWHREALGPARRLRDGCGGRWDPAPRLGAEQQLSQPGLHEHRQRLLRSTKDLRADLLVGRRDGPQQGVFFFRQPAERLHHERHHRRGRRLGPRVLGALGAADGQALDRYGDGDGTSDRVTRVDDI